MPAGGAAASARGAAAAASAREAASAAASAAAASATRAAGAAAGLGRSLSFTRRRSSKAEADDAGPRYTAEAEAAAPPAESESAASSQKRAASAAGAVRRTLSFGRRSSDALPRNWKRVTDAEGRESFFNALTNESTLERPKPLQRHWREALDKSTGAVYYWNVRTRAVRCERQLTLTLTLTLTLSLSLTLKLKP